MTHLHIMLIFIAYQNRFEYCICMSCLYVSFDREKNATSIGSNCFFTTYFSQLVLVLIGNNVLLLVYHIFFFDQTIYCILHPKTNYSKIIFVYIFLKISISSEFFLYIQHIKFAKTFLLFVFNFL